MKYVLTLLPLAFICLCSILDKGDFKKLGPSEVFLLVALNWFLGFMAGVL